MRVTNYKLQVISIFFAFCFLLFARSASAHVLKTDGTIGAVLHMTPDDDPIVNEPTELFFDIKDKSGNFDPSNCECKGIIMTENRDIHSTQLFDQSGLDSKNAAFSYIFDEKGIYKVKITGKPINDANFDKFDLTWDVRVAREKELDDKISNKWISEHLIHFLLIIMATIFVIIFTVRDRKRR